MVPISQVSSILFIYIELCYKGEWKQILLLFFHSIDEVMIIFTRLSSYVYSQCTLFKDWFTTQYTQYILLCIYVIYVTYTTTLMTTLKFLKS